MASLEPPVSQKPSAFSVLSRRIDSLLCFCIPLLCVGLIVFSSFRALHNAHKDPWTAVFAISAGVIILLLWLCFRQYEKLPSGPSPARDRLRIVIWLLAVLLNVIFSIRVTLLLDSILLACFIWVAAGIATLVGAYLLFFSSTTQSPAVSPSPDAPQSPAADSQV